MKKTVTIFLLINILTICSCQKEKEKTKLPYRYSSSYIDFEIEFPDTVYINKLYNGKIKYKSGLDSVITTFGDRQRNRYTRFIIAKPTVDVNYDLEYLRKKVKDTFGALDNRTIPFYDVKFSKLGVNYIDGLIDDIVLIDTIKNLKESDSIPLLRNEIRATRKVIVIEHPK